MKMAGRALEHHYRKLGLTVYKLAFRDHQRSYFKSLKDAQCQFYSNHINKNTGNSKQLFATISHLLEPQQPSSTEVTKERCNSFVNFFRSRANNIRSLMPGSHPPPSPAFNPLFGSLQFLQYFTEDSSSHTDEILQKMKSSSCTLDPIPTVLLKSFIPIVSPIITKLINLSLQTGHVPPSLKTAVLKKPSLDPEVLASYRPISNLTFLSKVLEQTVAFQLQSHLRCNNLFEKFQSGFLSAHSTETALLRVKNDLLMTADAGSPSLLILLDHLHHTVGLSGTALQWFRSYLSGRTEHVMLGGCKSRLSTVTCGVPQILFLGPILFTIYMLPLGHVISRHGLSLHCYADDTQLYIKTAPNPSEAILHITACLEEIKAWMNSNFLQLNSSKTEGLLVGTPHQIRSFPIS
uniref:Reverse transcriptase domain-containing protein n=1 Tax=Cyprinus carpio TaxID=7962 RepID=A0A8C2IWN8_CYPCA